MYLNLEAQQSFGNIIRYAMLDSEQKMFIFFGKCGVVTNILSVTNDNDGLSITNTGLFNPAYRELNQLRRIFNCSPSCKCQSTGTVELFISLPVCRLGTHRNQWSIVFWSLGIFKQKIGIINQTTCIPYWIVTKLNHVVFVACFSECNRLF